MTKRDLGVLASVTSAIEATEADVESIRFHSNEEPLIFSVHLIFSLNDVNNIDSIRVDSKKAEIRQEELHIQLTMEIDSVDSTRSGDLFPVEANHTKTINSVDENSANEGAKTVPGSSTSAEDIEKRNDKTTAANKEYSNPSSNKPQYQDPQRLRAVYEANETFEDMKEALDVDVTAQTVREYMIEYEIHNPSQRPDRVLESLQASEIGGTVGEEQNQSSRSDDENEDDA
jgi:hypothetical protein